METIFYISDSVGSMLLFGLIKISLQKNQRIIHSHSLSSAIEDIKKYHTEINKIIIADAFINDLEGCAPNDFSDFIHALKKLESIICEITHITKWCFLLDMTCYKGNKKDFFDYCEKNNITLLI